MVGSCRAQGPPSRAARPSACLPPPPSAAPQVAERLGEAIRGLQGLVADLRGACDEVIGGAARAKREVDAARRAMKDALRSAASGAAVAGCGWPGSVLWASCCRLLPPALPPNHAATRLRPPARAHQEARGAFDAAAARQRAGGRGRSVDADPWLTEGCLVECQVRLQHVQHTERLFLTKSFQAGAGRGQGGLAGWQAAWLVAGWLVGQMQLRRCLLVKLPPHGL